MNVVKCPRCNQSLMAGATQCQFCGAAIAPPPPRPRNAPPSEDDEPNYSVNIKWVWPVYYAIAGWWIFDGLFGVARMLLSKDAGSTFGIIGLLFSALTALIGLGLVLRVELVRGIVNILCFLQILFGLFGILGGFLMSFHFGLLAAIAMIMSIIQVITAIIMVFVIGETEARAPNF